jgi:hypothetical protein
MVALRKPPPSRMTVAEFLVWDPGDPDIHAWQLVDGEPVAMAPASDNHGSIQAALAALLWNHLAVPGSRCRVVVEPGIVPPGKSDRTYLIPDLGVTCSPPSSGQVMPNPVVLVEILSPSNEAKTRFNVSAYMSIPSVMEILVVNSTCVEVALYRRGRDGSWNETPDGPGGDGTVNLEYLGLVLSLSLLYGRTTLAAEGSGS